MKMIWVGLTVLAVVMTVPLGVAQATILSGSFLIDVYQGSGNGNFNDPNNWANNTNPLLSTTALYSGTYNGDIDFDDGGSNNILNFLNSAGGSLSGDTSVLNTTLSTSYFNITTVMDIRWTSGNRIAGTIYHDDGASLYLNGGVVVESAAPTSPITTPFGLTATGGDYRIVYAAANGLPERLTLDATQTIVPEPSSIALLGLALVAVGFRRKFNRS